MEAIQELLPSNDLSLSFQFKSRESAKVQFNIASFFSMADFNPKSLHTQLHTTSLLHKNFASQQTAEHALCMFVLCFLFGFNMEKH